MEQRLAFLLNSCKSGNLPAQEQVELSDLITEYFVSDSHPDQEWSDDDFQSESDAEQVARDDEVESDGEDRSLVNVDEVRGEGDCGDDMAVDAAPDDGGMLTRARQRSCKANGYGCKQIKVPGPALGDMRRGCITQFSPEEIVALQLSVQDMERGELVVSFLFCTFHSILVFYY